MTTGQSDYLPLSLLNQFEYCPRRFWYMHVLGEMDVNAPVLEGTLQHERAHQPGTAQAGEATIQRRVFVWSDRLRIAGFADLIEESGGVRVPIEYKRGRMGRWLNDHIQLCAQALCIEERTGASAGADSIAYGEIFYWGSRRRERVPFTPELRKRTEQSIAQVYALLAADRIPPPLTQRAKCKDCSLQPVCLPAEVMHLTQAAETSLALDTRSEPD